MRWMFLSLVTLLIGCAAPPIPRAVGELTLVTLVPAPGSAVAENTVIQATLDYRLSNASAGATYEITPMFADKRGPGYSFKAAHALSQSVIITAPQGRIELRYPIRAEWSSPRLARPIEVTFALIETENDRGRVLAEAGPFPYSAPLVAKGEL